MSRAAADALMAVFGLGPGVPVRTATIEVATPNPVNGSHGHWRAAATRRKRQRRLALLLCPSHPLPCVVRLTRLSAGELDDDNLRPALKAIRDGVADRLGVADNDPRVRWEYAQARAPRGQQAVLIEIRPATAATSEVV